MLISLYAVIKRKWFKKFFFWEISLDTINFKSENRITSSKQFRQSRRIKEGKMVAVRDELVSIFKKEFDVFKEKIDSDIRVIKSELRRQTKNSLLIDKN